MILSRKEKQFVSLLSKNCETPKQDFYQEVLGIILSTCQHIRRFFQYRNNGNLSLGSTALPSSWRCIIATAPTCSFWGTDINWNFHIMESFSRCRLLQTDSSTCCIDVNVFIPLQIAMLANTLNQIHNKLHLMIFTPWTTCSFQLNILKKGLVNTNTMSL